MAFTNKNDLFHALHQEEPGLSLGALQARVAVTVPKYRRPFVLAFGALALVLGSVALILNQSGDSETISSHLQSHSEFPRAGTVVTPIAETSNVSSASTEGIKTFEAHSSRLRTRAFGVAAQPVAIEPISTSEISSVKENAIASSAIVDTNARTDASSPKSEQHEKLPAVAEATASGNRIEHRSVALTESRFQFSGAIQAGVVMSSLNTTGGGLELEVHHDWQTLIVRYTTSFGLRRNGAELFRASSFTQHTDNSHQIVDIGLELGATLRQGDFWATIAAGPNYTKSSAESYFTSFGQPRTLIYSYDLQGVGGTAQANFGYKFSNLAGIALTGFVSNHTQTYGGILLSLMIGDLE